MCGGNYIRVGWASTKPFFAADLADSTDSEDQTPPKKAGGCFLCRPSPNRSSRFAQARRLCHPPAAIMARILMPIPSGTKLGPYEIVSPVGAGGMGEVYRARDQRLGRDVAVKVLPASFSRDPERLRRFEQEARAAAALNHPNILAVFDIGTHDDSPYLVTELLEGETLRERMESRA